MFDLQQRSYLAGLAKFNRKSVPAAKVRLAGGTLVNARETASSLTIGPGWSGTGIQGGESRRVAAGDVVFIPAGTPHMFSRLDGTIRYLTYRVDPARVLGLK